MEKVKSANRTIDGDAREHWHARIIVNVSRPKMKYAGSDLLLALLVLLMASCGSLQQRATDVVTT